MNWKAGISRAVMTPGTAVWLAGYGGKRAPEGKIHDLWIKTIAFEDADGHRAAIITCDHMGVPRAMYERICAGVQARSGLGRSQLMVLFSHNHCGPVLRGDLVDYYPLDAAQNALVDAYTDDVTAQMVESVAQAIADLQPAELHVGYGITRFAVNRRENPEGQVAAQIEGGVPRRGAVDHRVPVMTIRRVDNRLAAVMFGYACHTTTMSFTQWCGDYAGFAQVALEEAHPGTTALFFPGCGADQNPLPRRQVPLCKRYGQMLAAATEEVLLQPMKPLSGGLKTAFEFVDLGFERLVTRDDLNRAAGDENAVRARWARRILGEMDSGKTFESSYPYPVQVWRLGQMLMIALGAEAVVDYSHMFRHAYGEDTWVSGYSSVLVAYMPSHRVYHEGGYEGGPYLYEYGHPAERWDTRVEERITTAVSRMVRDVRG